MNGQRNGLEPVLGRSRFLAVPRLGRSRFWLLRELTLVPGSHIPVHNPFAGGTVEQLNGGLLVLGGGAGGLRLFERRPQRGTLRPVAHGGRARLAHVLLRGCEIRHEKLSRECSKNGGFRSS